MADFTIKQGDTLPQLIAVLRVGGQPISDLGNVRTIKLIMCLRDTPTIFAFAGTAVVLDVTAGKVAYNWLVTDTANPGEYLAEWHITYNDGSTRKVPTIGKFSVSIEASNPES